MALGIQNFDTLLLKVRGFFFLIGSCFYIHAHACVYIYMYINTYLLRDGFYGYSQIVHSCLQLIIVLGRGL